MRGFIVAGVLAGLLAAIVPTQAHAAVNEPQLIVDTTSVAIGARYRLGSNGPDRFDCSGFVWWTYNTAGLGDRVGTQKLRAREYQSYFRGLGKLYKEPQLARVGDLAFWGTPAVHVGIVTRVSHPPLKPSKVNVYVTSALTTSSGVREVRHDLIVAAKPFSGFASVGLVAIPDPPPTPTPTPSPPTPTPTPSPVPTPGDPGTTP